MFEGRYNMISVVARTGNQSALQAPIRSRLDHAVARSSTQWALGYFGPGEDRPCLASLMSAWASAGMYRKVQPRLLRSES
jgi:hypothetical protein